MQEAVEVRTDRNKYAGIPEGRGQEEVVRGETR
jgi:hypothetical protein